MYVRVLAPGETLKTKAWTVVPHDPINAQTYLSMGVVVLLTRDGCVVAMSEKPFDDDPASTKDTNSVDREA